MPDTRRIGPSSTIGGGLAGLGEVAGPSGPTALAKSLYLDGVNDEPARLATDPGGLYIPSSTGPLSIMAWVWPDDNGTVGIEYSNTAEAGTLLRVELQNAIYAMGIARVAYSIKMVGSVQVAPKTYGAWVLIGAFRDAADVWTTRGRRIGDAAWASSLSPLYTGMPAGMDKLRVRGVSPGSSSVGAIVVVERDLWDSGEADAWFGDPQTVPTLGTDDGVRYLLEGGTFPLTEDTGPNADHLTLNGYPDDAAAFPAGYPPAGAGTP